MSISSNEIIWRSWCPKCQKYFGHAKSKRKADIAYKYHLGHCMEVEPPRAVVMTEKDRTMILEKLEEW